MKTYLAFCDEFPVEFQAKSDEDAAKLCEFWGWELHDLPEDSLIADGRQSHCRSHDRKAR
jgi:hypothetical protein